MNRLKEFSDIFPRILKFQILTHLLFVFIILPSYFYIRTFIVSLNKLSVIDNTELLRFVFSPLGIILLIISLMVIFFYFLVELSGLIILTSSYQKERLEPSFITILKESIKLIPKFLNKSIIVISFYFLLLIPITSSVLGFNLFKKFDIPNFIFREIIKNPLYLIIYILIVIIFYYLFIKAIFTFHYILIKKEKSSTAIKKSFNLINDNFKDFFDTFILRILKYLVIFLIIFFLSIFIINFTKNISKELFTYSIIFLLVIKNIILTTIILIFIPLEIKFLTDKFYDATDFTFKDGISVNGQRVKVAHIKKGEEFNSLIHVLNAYQNGGTTGSIESIKTPKFIGQSYISLTGISDEYNRICINYDSKFSTKVLYSNIPSGDLFCASNRDTGINSAANSKNIYTRLPCNMSPFRRLVRNTETHGSETYNEFDVFRDNLVPSGIAFMNEEPTEEEINIAAYLGVPLVKIDDLQESFRKDAFSISKGGLAYDQSFYHIKEHEYENKEISVIPNDKYDVLINTIKEVIQKQPKAVKPVDVFSEKDEIGDEEYFVIYNNEKYSTIPVYDYVDSKRVNIEENYYEESLIKDKLYDFLDIKPRTKFVDCKYPNGKEVMSVISDINEPRLIDKYIDYLVNVSNSNSDLSDCSINSQEEINLLNKINSLDNNVYIGLFESLIKTSNYIEPSILLNNILSRKEQLNLELSKYNEMVNQSQLKTK